MTRKGGRWYQQALAGDRVVNGVYQPIHIVQVDAERYWGHSDVLNLDVCWERGELRWYDPVARRYLRTYDETDNELIAAEARIQELEAEITRLRNS